MTEISFYHLTSTSLEKALPKLLEKILILKKNVLVLTNKESQTDSLNDILWTYSTKNFLPHGSAKDGWEEQQPIFLTDEEMNPNSSSIIIILNNKDNSQIEKFEKCLYIFDGNDENELNLARKRWNRHKSENLIIKYWKQQPNGSWEQN